MNNQQIKSALIIKRKIQKNEKRLNKFMDMDLSVKKTRTEMNNILIIISELEANLFQQLSK